MNSRHRQSGLSAITILIIILVAVFFGTCAIKLIPGYMESFTVKEAVESTVAQAKADSMQVSAIRSMLSKQFQVNMIDVIKLTDITITKMDGKTVVDAGYEKRIPLMFNIDVVLKFDNLHYEF